MPTIAAFACRHRIGLPYAYPDNELSYAGNFLNMMFKTTEVKYQPNPVLERALTSYSSFTQITNRIAAPVQCEVSERTN